MSAYWGAEYEITFPAAEEGSEEHPLLHRLREQGTVTARTPGAWSAILPVGQTSKAALAELKAEPALRLRRLRSLAAAPGGLPVDYFEFFRSSALT